MGKILPFINPKLYSLTTEVNLQTNVSLSTEYQFVFFNLKVTWRTWVNELRYWISFPRNFQTKKMRSFSVLIIFHYTAKFPTMPRLSTEIRLSFFKSVIIIFPSNLFLWQKFLFFFNCLGLYFYYPQNRFI